MARSKASRLELVSTVEALERAVLRSWTHRDFWGGDLTITCEHCYEYRDGDPHAPDCIIPALLLRYADG